eukprot:5221692-Prymnesium_polylepis.1
MRLASRKMLNGRKIEIAVPAKDGFSGASWSFRDVLKDLWHAVSGNLRALQQPQAGDDASVLGFRRRVWIGFDGMAWTKRNGLVRWCVRCCDTVARHNDPKLSRDGITYAGADKNEALVAASAARIRSGRSATQ